MKPTVLVNTRSLSSPTTGVQRYLQELLPRLPADRLACIAPRAPLHGLTGHLWEQAVLPARLAGRLLWSPGNTGPLGVAHQVLTLHDVSVLEHPEWFSRTFSAWYRLMLPSLGKIVHRILTDSEFSRDRIVATLKVDPQKVVVIYPAADSRFVRSSPDEIAALRSQLGLPPGPYLLALGSLEPRKNLGRLLQAWESAQACLPADLHLVLSGAKGKSLVFGNVALNRLPPRVHLTGYVPDELLPALYSGALAFVYPSLYEGFGLPPLEAMACGTPVIVSRAASLPEVVGEAAVFVDPLDAAQISDAIQRLAADADLRSSLRQQGLDRARRFSWERTAQQTWDVLQQAAESRP